jgi:hypothetical protein
MEKNIFKKINLNRIKVLFSKKIIKNHANNADLQIIPFIIAQKNSSNDLFSSFFKFHILPS